jgi:stringent starvation protein B
MSTQHPLPPKKEVALALLERSSVHLHLDPRVDGVVVPPWFKKQPQLVLQIGLNMPVPIPDLRLDDDGLSCTLSFNRSPFFCVVPWRSVFAMVGEDQRGMVWPDDVPSELTQKAAAKPEAVPQKREREPQRRDEIVPASNKPKRARKKPQLAAVPAREEARGASKAEKAPEAEEAPAASPAPAAPEATTQPRSPVAQQPSRKPKRELPPYLRVVK